MGFTALNLHQFRNLKNGSYEFPSKEVFLIGENGQGKTNCLEALYLLCYGSSFRTRNDRLLIRKHENEASVSGRYLTPDGSAQDIAVFLHSPSGKEIRLNEKRVVDRKEILLAIPCVVFVPDDLEFIIGNPAKKRLFFNQTLCLYDLHYLDLIRNYKRVLEQRNACLKQKKNDMLEVYNQQLVAWGFDIQEKRRELLNLFNGIFQRFFRRLAKLSGDIEIRYKPSWRNCRSLEDCRAFLRKREEDDKLYRTTTSGPHRDQFHYFFEGIDFCQIASTGQIRLLSIILRVAQACFFTEYAGKKPILLLDDVLLELDAGRRELFIANLPEYEQAFFTFLPDEKYIRFKKASTVVYSVSEGVIAPWTEPEIY